MKKHALAACTALILASALPAAAQEGPSLEVKLLGMSFFLEGDGCPGWKADMPKIVKAINVKGDAVALLADNDKVTLAAMWGRMMKRNPEASCEMLLRSFPSLLTRE